MAFSKLRDLGHGYAAEADSIDDLGWYQLLEQFTDASIYQTISYDEVRSARKNISHLILKKDGNIVAIAQARVVKIPLIKAGVAYVRWGPMWHRQGQEADPEIFRQAIRALHNEYACKRGLVLRLYPVLFKEKDSRFADILAEEGFSVLGNERVDRTLRLNLNLSKDDLRSGMRQHWKRYLNVALKNNELKVIEGTDDEFFEKFIGIYRELVTRKRFAEPNDIENFRTAQRNLPEKFKMKIMLCMSGEKLCAGLICSAVGNTGIYLFGATSSAGLKSRGSYLLHWTMINQLKETGCSIYDLHGIDPVANPGTYKFKADLCGDNNGQDISFMGRFDSYNSVLSYYFVNWGDRFRVVLRKFRKKLADRSERASSLSSNSPEPLATGS